MKRYKVIWTKNAELDLELIIEYIKIDSISRAKKIFVEIKKSAINYTLYPWRIVYKIDNEKVYVLIVADSS